MNRRQFLATSIGTGAAAGVAALGLWAWIGRGGRGAVPPNVKDGLRSAGLSVVQRKSWALGSDVSIIALHANRQTALQAIDAALAELEHIERVMSIYRPESQLCRLNREGSLAEPDPLLVAVLQTAADMSQRSDGGFDVTVQPLWTVYADAKRLGKLPEAGVVETARLKVDWQQVDVQTGRIVLAKPGTAVTLNGIAQGLAADRVLEVLRAHGIENALVDTGETASIGRRADGGRWTTGIQHPRRPDAYVAVAKLDGRCMATSGDYATTFSSDYVFNHIFDPATGRSPTVFSSVTVVSPRCLDADTLSTAIFVVGAEDGLRLAKETGNTDVLLVFKDGRMVMTDGFPRAEA